MTKAQKEAIDKYHHKFDDIKVRIPKGEKEKIAAFAAKQGESVNRFIIRLIYREMGRPAPGKGESTDET